MSSKTIFHVGETKATRKRAPRFNEKTDPYWGVKFLEVALFVLGSREAKRKPTTLGVVV